MNSSNLAVRTHRQPIAALGDGDLERMVQRPLDDLDEPFFLVAGQFPVGDQLELDLVDLMLDQLILSDRRDRVIVVKADQGPVA